jgi:hypothetical protein
VTRFVVLVALGTSGTVLSGNAAALAAGATTPYFQSLTVDLRAQSTASICDDPPCPPPSPIQFARCSITMNLQTSTSTPGNFDDEMTWTTLMLCSTNSGALLKMDRLFAEIKAYSPLTAPAVTDTVGRTNHDKSSLSATTFVRYTNPPRIWCGNHYSKNHVEVDWPSGWSPINGTYRTLDGPNVDVCDLGS